MLIVCRAQKQPHLVFPLWCPGLGTNVQQKELFVSPGASPADGARRSDPVRLLLARIKDATKNPKVWLPPKQGQCYIT